MCGSSLGFGFPVFAYYYYSNWKKLAYVTECAYLVWRWKCQSATLKLLNTLPNFFPAKRKMNGWSALGIFLFLCVDFKTRAEKAAGAKTISELSVRPISVCLMLKHHLAPC